MRGRVIISDNLIPSAFENKEEANLHESLFSDVQFGGMKEGDFIVAIADKDVKWSPHEDVVNLIKDAGDTLSLKLVTPMDRNYLKVRNK